MSGTWKKVAKVLVSGLAYSARMTALHEGLSWDSGARFPESSGNDAGSGGHGRGIPRAGKKAPAP